VTDFRRCASAFCNSALAPISNSRRRQRIDAHSLTPHCNTMQITHCTALQRTGIHCNTVQHSAITDHIATHFDTHMLTPYRTKGSQTRFCSRCRCRSRPCCTHILTHTSRQHTTTRCNTLQHMATDLQTRILISTDTHTFTHRCILSLSPSPPPLSL